MNERELKPCPLCRSPHVNLARDVNGTPERGFCKSCGCCARIAAWNKRASATEVEQLKETLDRISLMISDMHIAPWARLNGIGEILTEIKALRGYLAKA